MAPAHPIADCTPAQTLARIGRASREVVSFQAKGTSRSENRSKSATSRAKKAQFATADHLHPHHADGFCPPAYELHACPAASQAGYLCCANPTISPSMPATPCAGSPARLCCGHHSDFVRAPRPHVLFQRPTWKVSLHHPGRPAGVENNHLFEARAWTLHLSPIPYRAPHLPGPHPGTKKYLAMITDFNFSRH